MGGKNMGIKGGRVLRYPGLASNDVFSSLAKPFQVELPDGKFGDPMRPRAAARAGDLTRRHVALPADLIALHRTWNRETAANGALFAEHRARVTATVLEAAEGQASVLALLGAGNCNDVDLAAFAARFQEVHLVDLDRESIQRASERQPPETRAPDAARADRFGGALARLDAFKKRALGRPTWGLCRARAPPRRWPPCPSGAMCRLDLLAQPDC